MLTISGSRHCFSCRKDPHNHGCIFQRQSIFLLHHLDLCFTLYRIKLSLLHYDFYDPISMGSLLESELPLQQYLTHKTIETKMRMITKAETEIQMPYSSFGCWPFPGSRHFFLSYGSSWSRMHFSDVSQSFWFFIINLYFTLYTNYYAHESKHSH